MPQPVVLNRRRSGDDLDEENEAIIPTPVKKVDAPFTHRVCLEQGLSHTLGDPLDHSKRWRFEANVWRKVPAHIASRLKTHAVENVSATQGSVTKSVAIQKFKIEKLSDPSDPADPAEA